MRSSAATGNRRAVETGQTVVLDGAQVAFVYELRDVDAGVVLGRHVIAAGELIDKWMIDSSSLDV